MDELVDALRDGGIVRVTEKEAREEGLVILRRPLLQATPAPPSRSPAKSAESRESMRHRLQSRVNNVRDDLIENFHWTIARARRLKNLSRYQLANVLNVSEEQIISMERGELPKDDYVLVNKLENYLAIKLRKVPFNAEVPKLLPPLEPAPAPPGREKQTYSKDVTLAELQKRKELGKKMETRKDLFDEDIQLIE